MKQRRGQFSRGQLALLVLGLVAGLSVVYVISHEVFGGFGSLDTQPDYQAVLFVNALVGISVLLFVLELRWDALRVVLTVIVALIIGYGVTAAFNLDAAARFQRGEFRVQLQSQAEVPDVEEMDLEYGKARGGEFNQQNAPEPLTEASYRFAGREGDTVTIIAAVTRQNIEADLEVALLDESGQVLAESQDSTAEQIEAYRPDLKSTKDAVIENFALPADGVYTIRARPEAIPRSTQISEMLSKTRLAYEAFLLGPLDGVLRWSFWVQDALTLILLGLAIAIVFRAEQFSLGAEGQLYFGALVSGVLILAFGDVPKTLLVPIALLSAATAGFLWGLLPGALKAYLGANELVSTLMLNTIATRFYEMVLTFQLQPEDAGYTASDWFSSAGILDPIVENTQVTIAVFVVIAVVIVTWLLIRRTPIGYEIRMIGANIKFANYGGVNSRRTIMLAMAISGAVAGLAGAHLGMGIHRKLILNISVALAFEGVVVALLARNNPLVVPFTGLLYAYLRTGARFMESDANVSFEVVRIIQAIIILLITAEALVTFFRRRRILRRGTVEIGTSTPPPLPGGGAGVPSDTVGSEEGAHV
ncbi:MAG: ABC transporter permease [Chloroflexi bacterium]|nr:ABC transporter permease [Chloroflexota bacterium]